MPRTNIFMDVILRQRTARAQDLAFSLLLAAFTVFSIASITTAG
jgi:hypothetical protein